jgi:3-oxoacyl-[acyl-carrier-protein] synthase III
MAVKVAFLGVGSYAPEKVLSNADFEKMVDTSDEWITVRTGIKERRVSSNGQATSDLAALAATRALEDAKVKSEELDYVITATVTPDTPFPSTSCYVQSKINASRAACFDVGAACAGFIYGLSTAVAHVRQNPEQKALLIGAETLSKITDYTDRASCILFGDGAGAAIIGKSETESDVLYVKLGSDGTHTDTMILPGGGSRCPATADTVAQRLHYMKIRGREVFKFAILKMRELMAEALEACNLNPEDLAMVIPHQVNLRVIEPAISKLGIPIEKVAVNIQKYGNTSAASIPLALDETVKAGKIKRGDLVMLVAVGAGLVWGVSLVRW